MRWLKSIGALLTSRWLISLVGAAVLALLVWFFGPAVALDGRVPLAGELPRLLTILGISLLWGVSNLWSLGRSRARGQAMVTAIAQPAPVSSDPEFGRRRRPVQGGDGAPQGAAVRQRPPL